MKATRLLDNDVLFARLTRRYLKVTYSSASVGRQASLRPVWTPTTKCQGRHIAYSGGEGSSVLQGMHLPEGRDDGRGIKRKF